MTARRRPKWIRARVHVDGRIDGCDVPNLDMRERGYKPGDRVVIMPAAEARELRVALRLLRALPSKKTYTIADVVRTKKRRARP